MKGGTDGSAYGSPIRVLTKLLVRLQGVRHVVRTQRNVRVGRQAQIECHSGHSDVVGGNGERTLYYGRDDVHRRQRRAFIPVVSRESYQLG
jgi:hypothetical protein